jgi:hypothetical protein
MPGTKAKDHCFIALGEQRCLSTKMSHYFKKKLLFYLIHTDAPRPRFVHCHHPRHPGAPVQAVLC